MEYYLGYNEFRKALDEEERKMMDIESRANQRVRDATQEPTPNYKPATDNMSIIDRIKALEKRIDDLLFQIDSMHKKLSGEIQRLRNMIGI